MGSCTGQCFPSFCPCALTNKMQLSHLVGLELIIGSFADLLHILYTAVDYCDSISYKHTRMLMFTCTHSCKGMHILRSHLVPVVRPLGPASHPSKKKEHCLRFQPRGSIFSCCVYRIEGEWWAYRLTKGQNHIPVENLGPIASLSSFKAVNNNILSLLFISIHFRQLAKLLSEKSDDCFTIGLTYILQSAHNKI